MTEILRRFLSRPILAIEMLLSSLAGNILALVSPIFVILVLNRYIAYGVDTTLATLATGTVLAIVLEYCFRRARYKFAVTLNEEPDRVQEKTTFDIITTSRISAFSQIPVEASRDIVRSSDSIRQIFSASNICAFLDIPFAFIFIFALYFLSPILCVITFCFVVAVSLAVLVGLMGLRSIGSEISRISGLKAQLVDAAITSPETIRTFDQSNFVRAKWTALTNSLFKLQTYVWERQNRVQVAIRAASALLTVLIISVGALQVVEGSLDVGAMIGANILAARALLPIVGLSQQIEGWVRARHARRSFADFGRLPRERRDGTTIKNYSGKIEARNLTFAYPRMISPLIDQLSFSINAGEVLCISGRNGSGKTTLAKLFAGILDPSRGQLLAEGIDLQQIAPEWWRKQIIYLPQEPYFIGGSIRQNFIAFNPELGPDEIRALLVRVGLEGLADEAPNGLDQELGKGGMELSLGVRRRLALARALAHDGVLAVLDEPTEGIDKTGATHVYGIMNELAQKGKTIIACSHDREIIRGAHHFLDLDEIPKPSIKSVKEIH
jgi:ATP-binding cassette subfamily C protein LapB